MISSLGTACLTMALPLSLYAIIMPLVGANSKSYTAIRSGYRALHASTILLSLAGLLVIAAFFTNDFAINYVASHSSSTLPLYYKFTGLWAGLDGSMLFWVMILSIISSSAIYRFKHSRLGPYMTTILSAIIFFFCLMLLYAVNPFDLLPNPPAEGAGLNPQLQNFYMSIHPPCLYLGYIGMSIPFAIAMAALITRELDDRWVRYARPWMIVVWFFLTFGNVLGMHWAYVELGWGGFWAWDPVENAAIFPWFTATAYLHSVMVQEKRGMLKVWNVSLISLTFLLTLFGTFLTRSGVVQSVHAFSNSTIGNYFVIFMILTIVFSLYFILSRLPWLKSRFAMNHLFSREGIFLIANLVLLFSTLAILWSTMFPTLAQWYSGTRVELGAPFFNQLLAPFGLAILVLMGFAPLLPWKLGGKAHLKIFTQPSVIALLVGIVSFALGIREWFPLLTYILVAFVSAVITIEYVKGVRALRRVQKLSLFSAIWQLIRGNNRRYGGYVIHIGMLLIFIGISGAVYHQEFVMNLKKGETFDVGPYHFTFEKLVYGETDHYESMSAVIHLEKNKKALTTLMPARHLYRTFEQPSTEVDIHSTMLEDVYLTLGNFDYNAQQAQIMLTINPLVNFLWLGGFVIVGGTALVLMKKRNGRLRGVAI